MNKVCLVPDGECLASRLSARTLRLHAESCIDKSQRITFDMSHVRVLSAAYADELYGVLARDLGLDAFVWHVAVHGASEKVMEGIAYAVKERLNGPDIRERVTALVTAKRMTSIHTS